MGDGDSIVEHLNESNIIVTQLISLGVNMDEEYHCMTLLFSFSIFMGQLHNGRWKHCKEIGA